MDGLGNALRVRLTAGQRHEATQADALIEGFAAGWVIADTAFDSDDFRAGLAARGTAAVIPSNKSRSKPIAHDEHFYRERHLVECFINKIKHFRRIATRYEKTARNFLAMITIACTMVWLR